MKYQFITIWAISADDKLIICFLFFSENRIMQTDNLYEMSNPVFYVNKKKMFQNVVCWKSYSACRPLKEKQIILLAGYLMDKQQSSFKHSNYFYFLFSFHYFLFYMYFIFVFVHNGLLDTPI